MPYITQAEAELNVAGFTNKTQEEKDSLILKSEAYLQSKCVPTYLDAAKAPTMLKQASYEIIKGTMAGVLFVGQKQQLVEKMVDADGLKVQKKFVDGSVELNPTEQYIEMLIAPFANCGKARTTLRGRI